MTKLSNKQIDVKIAAQSQVLLSTLGTYEKPGENLLASQAHQLLARNQPALNTLYEKRTRNSQSNKKQVSIIDSPVTTKKRRAFTQLILKKLNKLKSINQNSGKRVPVTLKDLIGSSGIDAFTEALAEEYNSQGFRDALLIRSLVTSEGMVEDGKKTVAWLGGSSGVGKSFSAIPGMNDLLKSETGHQEKILSLLIDGGVGREISQMRTLVIALSLALGYSGVSDLHTLTEAYEPFRPKDLIEKVATASNINKIIPETFVGNLHTSDINQYAEDHNIKQAFFLITQDNDTDDGYGPAGNDLQNATAYQGYKRAFAEEHREFNIDEIVFNGKLGIESKVYQEQNYKLGYLRSLDAMHNYCEAEIKNGNANPIVHLIKNDRVVYLADEKTITGWRRINDYEKPTADQTVIITSKRMMQAWKNAGTIESFESFAAAHANDVALTHPIIVPTEYKNLPPRPSAAEYTAAGLISVVGTTTDSSITFLKSLENDQTQVHSLLKNMYSRFILRKPKIRYENALSDSKKIEFDNSEEGKANAELQEKLKTYMMNFETNGTLDLNKLNNIDTTHPFKHTQKYLLQRQQNSRKQNYLLAQKMLTALSNAADYGHTVESVLKTHLNYRYGSHDFAENAGAFHNRHINSDYLNKVILEAKTEIKQRKEQQNTDVFAGSSGFKTGIKL